MATTTRQADRLRARRTRRAHQEPRRPIRSGAAKRRTARRRTAIACLGRLRWRAAWRDARSGSGSHGLVRIARSPRPHGRWLGGAAQLGPISPFSMMRHLLEDLERTLDRMLDRPLDPTLTRSPARSLGGPSSTPPRLSAASLALRGVAATALGLLGLCAPSVAFGALVLVFGAYAIGDGAVALAIAAPGPATAASPQPCSRARARALTRSSVSSARPRGTIALRGLASLLAGGVALFWPGFTAGALLCVAASWAVAAGALEIIAAMERRARLRSTEPTFHPCWLPLIEGALSIAFGSLGFLAPAVGAIALGLWLGAYGLVLGALWLVAAARARSQRVSTPPR